MSKRFVPVVAALALAGALSTTAAHAGEVNWSIGINLPPVATVISNGPSWQAPVVVAAPPQVIVQPAPRVVYEPAPVYYQPPPVYYQPAPRVVYAPPVREVVVVGEPRWHHHGRWVRDGRGWREIDWREAEWRDRHDQRGEWRGDGRGEAPREMLPPQRPTWR